MLKVTGFYDFRFEDEIEIAAPPEAGWHFFEEMHTHYTDWHPDHLRFEWRNGGGLRVGSEFYFEEMIAGNLQKKSVRITEVEENRMFAFVMTNPVFRFFLPRLSFGFEPTQAGFLFKAEIRLHGIGPMGRRLNRKEFDAVDIHMAEEGAHLKALIEGTARSFARAPAR